MDLSALPELIAATDGLPERPPESLNVYLDAVEACVRRYGWSRTSAQDIAREAGVNRTTVYRVLGAKDAMFQLLVAREVHRLIDFAAERAGDILDEGTSGAELLVEICASAIEQVRDNPTAAKLISDEPELVSEFMRDGLPKVVERFSSALGPLLGFGMQVGALAERDPRIMTEWMVRLCLSLLFAPSPIDLRTFLAEGIRPLFASPRPR